MDFNLSKILPIIDRIPLINIIPIFYQSWQALPEEKKQEIATNLIMAASKAAASYAGKK